MSFDHEAIYEAYKSESKPVVAIDDASGAYDADGNKVELDDAKIAAVRKSLDDAAALVAYKLKRKAEYPPIEDQLDTIYHSGVAGWKTKIKAIKDKYPKPS